MILRGEITAKDQQRITANITLSSDAAVKTSATVQFDLPR
jgi:hypothetical protein